MKDEDKSPADLLEQALRDLETRKKAAADMAANMAPELERLDALQKKLDALPQSERRQVLDAMGLKHVSAAPKPITPLSGRASSQSQPRTHDAPPDIDWQFWKNMRTVKLWQACALIVGLDPDTMRPHPQTWMAGPGAGPIFVSKSFSSADQKQRFDKALRLAMNAVSYMNGPIFPKGSPHPGNNGEKDVALTEVAAYMQSLEWPDIPEPLQTKTVARDTEMPNPIARPDRTPQQLKELDAMRVPPDGGISMGSRLRALNVQEPQSGPFVAEDEPGSGEPDRAGPLPLTTGDIAFCFAGLRWDEQQWKKPLGDKPKWLQVCIAIPGARGISETRWNPVLIGAALIREGHAKSNSVRAKFQTVHLLQPWLETWKTYEADNFQAS